MRGAPATTGRLRRPPHLVVAVALVAAMAAGGCGGGDGAADQAVVDSRPAADEVGDLDLFCDAARRSAAASTASGEAETPAEVEAALGDLRTGIDDLLLAGPEVLDDDLLTLSHFLDAASEELVAVDFDQDRVDFDALDGAEQVEAAYRAVDEVTLDDCDVAASGIEEHDDEPIGDGGEPPPGG